MKITKAALDAIVAHARDALPGECCGLLIGTPARIDSAYPARNLETGTTRFLIDPRDHFGAVHAARDSKRFVIGVYHSHPKASAAPIPVLRSLASNEPEGLRQAAIWPDAKHHANCSRCGRVSGIPGFTSATWSAKASSLMPAGGCVEEVTG